MTRLLLTLIVLGALGFVAVMALRTRAAGQAQAAKAPNPEEIEALGKQAVERAKADVKKFGWHMVAVPGEGDEPGAVFTIGLWKTYHHPELILFTSGDPRAIASRLSAMAKRVAGGEVFAAGKTYDGLFGKFSGSLRKVQTSWYVEFVGTAMGFYESDEFPVLQVFWPDKEGLFPWQSGFEADLFGAQPLLYETNLVLANVSQEARDRWVAEEGPETLRASWAELFVDLPSDSKDAALADWRWLVGPDAKLFRVTLFGDLFLQTPDGHIHWLDTGFASYEEVADDESEWNRLLAINLPYFFHASTLLGFRDLKFLPKAGQVYSWQRAPILGGEEKIDNFETVPATVHISFLGQLARSAKDIPPGSEISTSDFTPSGPAGSPTEDPSLRYQVVLNDEEQYSIWPEGRKIPDGWRSAGKTGTKRECLDYIKEVWVDMRPLSLRKAMAEQEKEKPKEMP